MDDAVELAHKAYTSYTTLNYSEAIHFASESLELDAGNVYAWYVKGCVYQELKDYTEAINAYRKGLEGNPLEVSCFKGIAHACFMMKDYLAALHWTQTWLKSLGPSKPAYNMVAKCKWKLGEPLQAIEYYEKSQSLKLDDETLRKIADIYMEMSDYDNAINAINQAIEISQQMPENIIQLAKIYERMQDLEKALDTIQSVFEKDKNNIYALEYQGLIYYKLGNLDKSESTCQHILKMDQNNLIAMSQLSLCYFDRKKYLIAAALLEKVNELNPNDSQTLFHMAKCLYHLDRKISSLYYVKECLSTGPNNAAGELLETIMKYLQIN